MDKDKTPAQAQEEYCHKHHLPLFAPRDGKCFHCGCDIYATYGQSAGISFDRAATTLISGCPHCHHSFCD